MSTRQPSIAASMHPRPPIRPYDSTPSSSDAQSIQGGLLGLIGSIFGSAMGAAALIFWHGYARQVDGSELFPLLLDRNLFIAKGIARAVKRPSLPIGNLYILEIPANLCESFPNLASPEESASFSVGKSYRSLRGSL